MNRIEKTTYAQKAWWTLTYDYIVSSLIEKPTNDSIKNEPIGKIIKLEDKNDKELLFAQYKILVEVINKNNEHRETLNNFWLTLNGTIFAAIAYVKDMQIANPNPKCLFIWALWGVGTILAMIWLMTLSSIKKNIDMKNEILIQVENFLPAKIFTAVLTATGRRKGKNSLSSTEKIIPMLFFNGYIILGVILFVYPNIFL